MRNFRLDAVQNILDFLRCLTLGLWHHKIDKSAPDKGDGRKQVKRYITLKRKIQKLEQISEAYAPPMAEAKLL